MPCTHIALYYIARASKFEKLATLAHTGVLDADMQAQAMRYVKAARANLRRAHAYL